MRARFLILAGVLLLASDAGATRTPHFSPQSIAFWDARHGIATFGACGHVSCLGEIRTTNDGGRTWRVLRHEPRLSGAVVTQGSRAVWVQTARGLIHSVDGGAVWFRVPRTARLFGLSFPSPRVGFALRGEQFALKLLETDDGGARWRKVRLPCGDLLLQHATISFPTARHGWMICSGQPGAGSQAKALYETLDGTGHWRRISQRSPLFGSGYVGGMSMSPSGTGLAWEARGSTFRTVDGGRHWRPLSITMPESREGVSASLATRRMFYLLVRDNTRPDFELMRSRDGGRSWRVVRSWSR